MENLENALKKRNIKISIRIPVHVNWKNSKKHREMLKNMDGIIVNGEGTLHHGNGEELIDVSEVAKKENIPIFLINSTYDNNPPYFKKYLKNFNNIYVRESLSCEQLKKIDISTKIVPDLSFYGNINKCEKKGKGVAITDATHISYKKIRETSIGKKYGDSFLSIWNGFQIKINEGAQPLENIYIFSHNISKGVIHKIKHNIPCFLGKKDFLKMLCNFNQIISGRFHIITLALQRKVHITPVESNSHKIQGLMKDIGLNVDVYKRYEYIDNLNYFNNDDWEKIYKYNNEAKEKIEKMFDEIGESV